MLLKSSRNETALNRFYNFKGNITFISSWESQFHFDGKTGPRLRFWFFPSDITPTAATQAAHEAEIKLFDPDRNDKTFTFYGEGIPAATYKIGYRIEIYGNNIKYVQGVNRLLAGTHVIASDTQYDIGNIGTDGFADYNLDGEINSGDALGFFEKYEETYFDVDADGIKGLADALDHYDVYLENNPTLINQYNDFSDD